MECDRVPLVPVTVTLYFPAPLMLLAHDRTAVCEEPDTMTLVALREQLRPVFGETDELRATGPAKPLIGVTVIVEFPVFPAKMVTAVGLLVTVKSGG